MSPSDRSLRARIGAYSLHAQGKTTTTAARKAFLGKFDVEVDPDGVLPENERLRRAEFDVVTFPGSEISQNGSGGPTCLTRPLLRGAPL